MVFFLMRGINKGYIDVWKQTNKSADTRSYYSISSPYNLTGIFFEEFTWPSSYFSLHRTISINLRDADINSKFNQNYVPVALYPIYLERKLGYVFLSRQFLFVVGLDNNSFRSSQVNFTSNGLVTISYTKWKPMILFFKSSTPAKSLEVSDWLCSPKSKFQSNSVSIAQWQVKLIAFLKRPTRSRLPLNRVGLLDFFNYLLSPVCLISTADKVYIFISVRTSVHSSGLINYNCDYITS